jgi:hypothetical protein
MSVFDYNRDRDLNVTLNDINTGEAGSANVMNVPALNNAIRQQMAYFADYITLISGQLTTTSTTTDAYLLDQAVGAYVPIFTGTTYPDGFTVRAKIHAANTTTTPTLKVGAGSAKTIVQCGVVPLVIGDLMLNQIYEFRYSLSNDNWGVTYAPFCDTILKTGGAMTGFLSLVGAPTSALHATTKAYVDGLAFDAIDLPGQSGQAGNVLGTNGTIAGWYPTNDYVKPIWSRKTANYTAVSGDYLAVDTTGGAVTITLPATPSEGDTVVIQDDGYNATFNNITVGRNSETIHGVAEDFVIDITGAGFRFVYLSGDWRVL